ncbi:hypothetical protein BDY19DRAFT_968232 [Irpex rosettiformis]|uniref:Uncharacterized protein n=1 Tax=Irpex rosettiformis TaxID=378272 RepID=A0ACB8TSB8_9APHY|nr:hypothetical protein BDY19DRAFT_968232 [Irpex rosettiformis]
MGEITNFVVAVAVIVLVFRWATSSKDTIGGAQSPSAILGFKPKTITPEQVETIHSMFPDIPSDNIRYDLLRTGSVQQTSNKILERGFLPPPPAGYYQLYPRAEQPAPRQPAPQPAAPTNAAASSSQPKVSLISKYNLQNRVSTDAAGAESSTSAVEPEHKWEESAEKREANLRERKARMVLAARQCVFHQQPDFYLPINYPTNIGDFWLNKKPPPLPLSRKDTSFCSMIPSH